MPDEPVKESWIQHPKCGTDLIMIGKALRDRYPITAEIRQEMIEGLINASRDVELKWRDRWRALNTLLMADRLNMEQESRDDPRNLPPPPAEPEPFTLSPEERRMRIQILINEARTILEEVPDDKIDEVSERILDSKVAGGEAKHVDTPAEDRAGDLEGGGSGVGPEGRRSIHENGRSANGSAGHGPVDQNT